MLTALRRLDGSRKGLVVRFLDEARLIETPNPKVDLRDADLRGALLVGAQLERPELSETRLDGADFRDAKLVDARFYRTSLRGADFTSAHFEAALKDPNAAYPSLSHRAVYTRGMAVDFSRASLQEARFDNAYVSRPKFGGADLRRTSFRRARVPAGGFRSADLRHADFTGAYVGEGRFWKACVSYARFVRADLTDARFDAQGRQVDLSLATLDGLSSSMQFVLIDVITRGASRDDRTRLFGSVVPGRPLSGFDERSGWCLR
jgi:uncharacterized protein YjbI with pentapeptide repeats